MIKIAEKFDVSGSYLARVCTALRVPRPERGYWAKLAVGKALEFANDLFNALESAGHRVVIATPDAQFWRERVDEKEVPPKKDPRHDPYGYDRRWSPYRPTVTYVDSVAFGLAVIEMTESVEMRYVNGKYIRESEYVPPFRP
ncbi:MAG: hypothetical protein WCZ87_02490, partial [Thiohalobacteraceae bacterium]